MKVCLKLVYKPYEILCSLWNTFTLVLIMNVNLAAIKQDQKNVVHFV